MNRNEKKAEKLAKDLNRMKAQGWGVDREYICIVAKEKNRLVYGWTKPRDERVYCPYHNEIFDESEGHFEIVGENCRAA